MRKKECLTFYFDGFNSIKQINKEITITEEIRPVLHLVFIEKGKLELTRKELIAWLVEVYRDMTNDDGKVREGVFDGMSNKSEKIPIPFVKKIKRGNKTFYIYTGKNLKIENEK